MSERRIAVLAVSNSQISDVLVPNVLDWIERHRSISIVAGIDTTRITPARTKIRDGLVRAIRGESPRSSARPAFPRVFRAAGIAVIDARSGRGVNEPSMVQRIADLKVDCILSLGCGQILRPGILEVAPMGFVNYHYSPLPRLGGLHAAFWALLYGDHRTANTFHVITPGIDEGPIVAQEPVEILADDTVAALQNRLVQSAPPLLHRVLEEIARGKLTRRAQDASGRLYRSEKDFRMMGEVCWDLPARVIERIAKLNIELSCRRSDGELLTLKGICASAPPYERRGRPSGEILAISGAGAVVACADAAVTISGIRGRRSLAQKLLNRGGIPSLSVGERLIGRELSEELDGPVIQFLRVQAA